MMKALLMAAAVWAGSWGTPPTHAFTRLATETKVWVCDSQAAVAYHQAEDCRGLGRCKHTILKMTVKDAEARGLRKCKVCY